ncbi:hypothetical protein [Fructobacillus fructosus]|uniref:Uncharacterized protein n=1 Tax=Fructobacillus fructosus TaxID=1631 RepID=A0ABN9YN38_9LACO|nr:hypothetical protein [Fructobacillus fructosus]MBC9119439.1 hypothetical protein [Fructobacillus fructosus]MBD9367038.1 hypothetical protein [Leuconostoc mesenteroides]CAK1230061.1 unnamed protein product [Fructobacillus fructosus]
MNRLVAKFYKELEFKSLTKKQRQFYQELHYYFRGETEADFSNLYYIEGFTGDELDKRIEEILVRKILMIQSKLYKWATNGGHDKSDVLHLIIDYQNLLMLIKYTDIDPEQMISISII